LYAGPVRYGTYILFYFILYDLTTTSISTSTSTSKHQTPNIKTRKRKKEKGKGKREKGKGTREKKILSMATAGAHPYYPLGAQLSGGVFTPNTWDVLSLILSFLAALAVLLVVTLAVVTKVNPNLKLSDQLLALWFVMSK